MLGAFIKKMTMMTESEFLDLTDAVFNYIENAIDQAQLDVDLLNAGNVLELTLESGDKIIITRHMVNKELWIAAKSGAYHYHFQNDTWKNTRTGSLFFEDLTLLIPSQGSKF